MSSPIYVDDRVAPTPEAAGDAGVDTSPERVRRLEEEVLTLRDTMSRFAELVLGELKQIREPGRASGVAPGAVPVPDTLVSAGSDSIRRPWLLIELLRDFTTCFRMYLDPRYRVRRSTQILVPVMLGLFVANYLFWSAFPIPFLPTILQKAGDIVLAVILYKVLSREMTRYREALIQYAAWEQLRANLPHSRVVHSDTDSPHAQVDPEG